MEESSMEQSSLLVGDANSDEATPNYNYSAIFGEDTANSKYSKETVLGNVSTVIDIYGIVGTVCSQ